ncbi:MAG: FAD-dependent monooxygenase [Microbacteriaceae bacterium]|nr:FAD-dependent monooxygenase [Microbacteriaceae bacterium]MCL2794906.1 FAD-dependent monooxygenase [Microbacteriaceae bacterium]
MSAIRTALVIGGGIAGHTAAMALQKAGVEASVYEAYPSPADAIGGPIALAANGVAGLRVIGAESAVLDHSYPISRQATQIGAKTIGMPSLADVPAMRIILRRELYAALHELAAERGVETHYGKRLVAADETGAGVTARFDDGTTATADLLIGADGVHSTARRLIDAAAPGPKYTGMLSVDGWSPLEFGDPDVMYFTFGQKAYYLYWRHPEGGTVWGANLPQAEPMSVRDARAVASERWRATLLATYGADSPGGDLIRSTPPERLSATGALFIMPSVPHWSRGRLVLVGDAVHAPSNSSGQGASLSIESAVELAKCLRDAASVDEAVAAYETLRRPRVEGIARRANRVNQTKAPGRLGRAMAAALMPLIIKAAMDPEKTFGPDLRYRIDWDERVAAR